MLAVFLWTPAAAAAADGQVTLATGVEVARYGAVVRFTGAVSPSVVGEPVHIYEQKGERWHRVVSGRTRPDGTFRLATVVSQASLYVARTARGESAPVKLVVQPLVETTLVGTPVVGGALALSGRVLPANAGSVELTIGRHPRPVRVGRGGGFHADLPTGREESYEIVVELAAVEGYADARRVVPVRVQLPALAPGARSPAVLELERRLAELRGMARTGRVDRAFWRALARARVPRPRAGGSDHIEVDKTRQLLFEVRGGEVAAVLHVSTGATGNTPIGRWHVYRKVSGWNWILWYPMYFLRGFAIHGYPSVPPYPASHGCVRVPMWYAAGLYAGWPHGTTIWVFP